MYILYHIIKKFSIERKIKNVCEKKLIYKKQYKNIKNLNKNNKKY